VVKLATVAPVVVAGKRRTRRRGKSSTSCNAEKGGCRIDMLVGALRLPPRLGLVRQISWSLCGCNDALPEVWSLLGMVVLAVKGDEGRNAPIDDAADDVGAWLM